MDYNTEFQLFFGFTYPDYTTFTFSELKNLCLIHDLMDELEGDRRLKSTYLKALDDQFDYYSLQLRQAIEDDEWDPETASMDDHYGSRCYLMCDGVKLTLAGNISEENYVYQISSCVSFIPEGEYVEDTDTIQPQVSEEVEPSEEVVQHPETNLVILPMLFIVGIMLVMVAMGATLVSKIIIPLIGALVGYLWIDDRQGKQTYEEVKELFCG